MRRVQFLTGRRRPMRSLSPGAVGTVASRRVWIIFSDIFYSVVTAPNDETDRESSRRRRQRDRPAARRGVAKELKVPCLFMITEVSIRCQKNPGGWYTPYTHVYRPIHHCLQCCARERAVRIMSSHTAVTARD